MGTVRDTLGGRRGVRAAVAVAALAGSMVWGSVAGAGLAGAATSASPPGPPTSGYGSPANSITSGYTEGQTGNTLTGSYVWWFVPDKLREGTKAPVVVLLHGFELQAPQIYYGLIDHLTDEGDIVIYPQFNLGGLIGILLDNNQNTMLQRAVAATNTALAAIGPIADRANVYLFGHSLGGEMAACWTSFGGVAPRAILFANPSVNPEASLPSFVQDLVHITPLPWQTCASSVTVPTMILTGDQDTIAPPTADPLELDAALTHAHSTVVYEAHSDSHGSPSLVADHMAPTQSTGILPSFLADLVLDGTGTQDALDWRYYYAAFDALMAGQTTVTFQMGSWSDGTPVAPVTTLAP